MIIFPAIDLKDGKVVRLAEGDYTRMIVYADDPASVAMGFIDAGATHLHVVDLDAARSGETVNFPAIEKLARLGLFLQVGGGGRDDERVKRYLNAGASRVVIGTAAVTLPGFLQRMANAYPGQIAAGVDARDGKIAIHGWRELTDIDAFEFLQSLPSLRVDTAIYTDISRDGLLTGANIEAYRQTRSIDALNVVASGGVSSYEDIRRLKKMGLYAAIIGRALYTGAVELKEAIRLGEEEEEK